MGWAHLARPVSVASRPRMRASSGAWDSVSLAIDVSTTASHRVSESRPPGEPVEALGRAPVTKVPSSSARGPQFADTVFSTPKWGSIEHNGHYRTLGEWKPICGYGCLNVSATVAAAPRTGARGTRERPTSVRRGLAAECPARRIRVDHPDDPEVCARKPAWCSAPPRPVV